MTDKEFQSCLVAFLCARWRRSADGRVTVRKLNRAINVAQSHARKREWRRPFNLAYYEIEIKTFLNSELVKGFAVLVNLVGVKQVSLDTTDDVGTFFQHLAHEDRN
jgi:hypothetical protein